MSALAPTLPTFFRSAMLAIPRTIVRKMIGPMTILTRFTKVSPNGLMALAVLGERTPRSTPRAIAIRTRTVRFLKIFKRRGGRGAWTEGTGSVRDRERSDLGAAADASRR